MIECTTAPARAEEYCVSERLEQVFSLCFGAEYATQLVGGAREPLYQPALGRGALSTVYYRADYFASALHEVSHWCLAGTARRGRVDYGYWYASDGRDAATQQAFEAVEYKPQALEWIFSRACGWRFRVSVDNLDGLNGQVPDTQAFQRRIFKQVTAWQAGGLPERAKLFFDGLQKEFTAMRAAKPHSAQPLSTVAPTTSTAADKENKCSCAAHSQPVALSQMVFTLAELQ